MSECHLAAAAPHVHVLLIQHQIVGDRGLGPDLFALAILEHLFGRASVLRFKIFKFRVLRFKV